MILVDTSIWIDHLSRGDAHLAALLQDGEVLGHPWVQGELALGNLAHRDEVLGLWIGYVDAQLLASTRLAGDARLWTRDKRLRAAAQKLEVAHDDSRNA